jgi:hypothetical protein
VAVDLHVDERLDAREPGNPGKPPQMSVRSSGRERRAPSPTSARSSRATSTGFQPGNDRTRLAATGFRAGTAAASPAPQHAGTPNVSHTVFEPLRVDEFERSESG